MVEFSVDVLEVRLVEGVYYVRISYIPIAVMAVLAAIALYLASEWTKTNANYYTETHVKRKRGKSGTSTNKRHRIAPAFGTCSDRKESMIIVPHLVG